MPPNTALEPTAAPLLRFGLARQVPERVVSAVIPGRVAVAQLGLSAYDEQ